VCGFAESESSWTALVSGAACAVGATGSLLTCSRPTREKRPELSGSRYLATGLSRAESATAIAVGRLGAQRAQQPHRHILDACMQLFHSLTRCAMDDKSLLRRHIARSLAVYRSL